jgi:DNA-binding NarL/FixJ family response regulator
LRRQFLTKRQTQIARLIPLGWPDKRIASALNIATGTVKNHLRIIFLKLGIHSRVQLAVLVVRRRIAKKE